MEKAEAVIFKAEEVHFENGWVPSWGLASAYAARQEGKLVILRFCCCGDCPPKVEKLARVKEVFGDDPLVIGDDAVSNCAGKDVLILPQHRRVFPFD